MYCEKNYNTILGYECLNSCISNYLFFYGKNISPSDVFFLGDGFHISISEKPQLSINTTMFESNFNFLNKYYRKYKFEKLENREEALLFLNECVRNDKSISIKVSSECLTHNSVFQRTSNSPHYLNVIGIDQNTEKLCISDGYVPTDIPCVFQGKVNIEGILEGWKRMQYNYLLIEDFTENIKNKKNIVLKKIKDGIVEYLGNENGSKSSGKKVIEKMLDIISNETNGGNAVRELLLKVNYELRICGFISSKIYLLKWIEENNFNKELSKRYLEVITAWQKFCNILVKCGFSFKSDLFSNARVFAEDIMSKEDTVLDEIYMMLQDA